MLRLHPARRLHFDQIERLAAPDQDVGSDANAIAREGGFVDRGHGTVSKRLARRRDGELVVKMLVVDQHAAGEPLPGDYPNGMSGIKNGSRYRIDRRSEPWLETLEIEPFVALKTREKAAL